MANIGFPSTSFGVYQPYLVAMQGIGDVGGSIVLSVRTLVSMVAMFFVNAYYNRLGARAGVSVATAFTAAGFFVYSLSSDMVTFCLGAVLVGLGYSLGGMVPLTLLVGRWFKTHVGTAAGIGSLGSGISSLYIPLLALWGIENVSLGFAFALEAACALAVVVIALVFIRNHPADLDILAYGQEREMPQNAGASPAARAKSALELPVGAYRVFLVAMGCLGMTSVGGFAFLSLHVIICGFDAVFAAHMVSLLGICLLIAKFVVGELFDHIGTLRGSILTFAMLVIGLALCTFVAYANELAVVAGSVLLGAGTALGTVGISVYSLELSLPKTRAKTVRDFQIAYALGGFAATMLPGPLAALTGGYMVSFAMFLVASILAFAIVVTVYRSYRPSC